MNDLDVYQEIGQRLASLLNQEDADVCEQKIQKVLIDLHHKAFLLNAEELSKQTIQALPSPLSHQKLKALELMIRCVMASNPEYEQGLNLMEAVVIALHGFAKQIKSK